MKIVQLGLVAALFLGVLTLLAPTAAQAEGLQCSPEEYLSALGPCVHSELDSTIKPEDMDAITDAIIGVLLTERDKVDAAQTWLQGVPGCLQEHPIGNRAECFDYVVGSGQLLLTHACNGPCGPDHTDGLVAALNMAIRAWNMCRDSGFGRGKCAVAAGIAFGTWY